MVLTCGNRKPTQPPPLETIAIRAGQHFDYGESWRWRSQVESNLTEYC
jgi:hypothetical protein